MMKRGIESGNFCYGVFSIIGYIMIVLGFSNESLLMKVVAILIMALMIAWTWILRGLVYSKIGLLK